MTTVDQTDPASDRSIEIAYRQILGRARGRDVRAGICQTFPLSIAAPDAYGGWSPRTMGRLDPGLQAAMLTIIHHLCTAEWRPDRRDVQELLLAGILLGVTPGIGSASRSSDPGGY